MRLANSKQRKYPLPHLVKQKPKSPDLPKKLRHSVSSASKHSKHYVVSNSECEAVIPTDGPKKSRGSSAEEANNGCWLPTWVGRVRLNSFRRGLLKYRDRVNKKCAYKWVNSYMVVRQIFFIGFDCYFVHHLLGRELWCRSTPNPLVAPFTSSRIFFHHHPIQMPTFMQTVPSQ